MSNAQTPSIAASTDQITKQIAELTELDRVVSNGLNWVSDIDVKVAYIKPVSEFVSFLQGFKANVAQQKTALENVLPKQEAKAEPLTVPSRPINGVTLATVPRMETRASNF